jgi:hypothetical protein
MSFEKSVFINCPFDKTYIDDLLKPTLYVLVKNGYFPRLSIEVSDSGQVRLQKIIEIIKSCKYSIHDLSIVKSKQVHEFARMNMPFELGIDCGLRNSGISKLNEKQFLILEATKYDYMKAVSDINGFDIKVHGNETEKIFECLYSWSSETLKINKQDPPLKLFYEFIDFNTNLFEEKVAAFGSVSLAKNYIEKISIPEYINEIRERV